MELLGLQLLRRLRLECLLQAKLSHLVRLNGLASILFLLEFLLRKVLLLRLEALRSLRRSFHRGSSSRPWGG